jgi:type I restriction enzyme S subunit
MEITAIKPTFQKYPAYIDSGVEWLGEIPEHWDAIKMKYLFRDVSEKNRPDSELLSVTQDQGVVPRTWVENRMVMPSGNLESFKFIQKGDFAISLRSFEGGLEYCHHDGIISPAYTVLKKKNGLFDGYYKYLFKSKSFISEVQTSVVGIREGKNINYFELSYSLLPIPPLQEQTAIANFLDDKTAKIDRAIAQKEKMIALLKERKQIIIQNAVTKGLNPNAKMKDSGVEWIGEIPEGWEVKRLKYVLKTPLKYGANEVGVEYSPNLPRYVRITDFSMEGKLREDKKLSLTWEIGKQYLLEDGDILFARSGATVGKSYQFKKSMSIESHYSFAGYLIKASPNEDIILSDFLNYYTMSGSFENWKSLIFNKATIENIGADKYSELIIALAPICEQTAIITHIEAQSTKIDKAISLQERQIEKLKELKSTLIDSAVTGKIKVC